MKRRQFVLAGLAAAASSMAVAQARPVKIGMLSARPLAESFFASEIVRGLASLGYREGAGMVLEFRSEDSATQNHQRLARELIDLKCDVIFVVGSESATRSLRGQRVPIVILATDYDPVAKGFVGSLSKPGGNITGVYLQIIAVVTKRLEILREAVPGAGRFLVLADPFSQDQLAALRKAAEAMRVSLTIAQFSKRAYDFEAAFESGRAAGVQGLVIPASPVLASNVPELVRLAGKHRLPAIGFVTTADAGFLLSYSVDNRKVAMRVAELGAKILQGAKPADMPMEQVDEFELVINLKTAKALGVKIPYSVMARATRVIE